MHAPGKSKLAYGFFDTLFIFDFDVCVGIEGKFRVEPGGNV